MDISGLSSAQLAELQQKIPAEINRRQSAEKEQVMAEVEALINERGFGLELLEEILARKQKRGVGRPKVAKSGVAREKVYRYRHPENPSLQWTGAGRRPFWIIEWSEAHNGDLSALMI